MREREHGRERGSQPEEGWLRGFGLPSKANDTKIILFPLCGDERDGREGGKP